MQVNLSICEFNDIWAGGGVMEGTYQRGDCGCGGGDVNCGGGGCC